MTRARRRMTGRHRALVGLMAAVASGLLAGALVLSLTMLQQTQDLDTKLRITQDIVDANVRTLSQVQREVLRLDVLLHEDDPGRAALRLQSALVSQRVQEGTLSYQRETLGSTRLLATSRRLARRWRTGLRPEVMASLGPGARARARRARLATGLESLERGYNQLVSDGEINRKVNAGAANSDTRVLLHRARLLLVGLLVTFATIVSFLLLGGMAYRAFHRQRERASAALLELNGQLQRHAHVVSATDNMVVVTDPDGLVEWVNPAFEHSTGYSLADLAGRRPGEVLQDGDTDAEAVRRMGEALRRGRGFHEEVLNHTRDGRPYWVAVDVSPVRDQDGRLTGFVSVQTDITERRRAEDLLRVAKEAAEETAREKSNFLASMSHEIRTPLNAVLGLTDLLLLTELSEDQRDYVRTAHTSGRLLLALVNDILDFSALEAGRIRTEDRAFAVRGMLDDTVRMLRTEPAQRDVRLECHVGPEVPAYLRGDETRLRQVLVNLVGNGLKFTEHGLVRLDVSSTRTAAGCSRLRLSVADTGIGIPQERIPHLFQPFTQVDASTSRRFGGTGLGLAICRLLVERMGGSISVESTEGAGSRFTVEVDLPVAQRPDVDDLPATDASRGDDVRGLRVLLAEDDPVNQTVASHMLRRLGLDPVVVGDGAAAVEAARGQAFDVVLMDVHMPRMDGVEATRRIRAALGAGAPRVVAVTANALDGDRERLLAAGMDDYLSKPVQLETMLATLHRAVPGLVPGLEPGPVPAPADAPAPVRPGPVDEATFVARTGVDDPGFLVELVTVVVAEGSQVLLAAAHGAGAPSAGLTALAHRLAGAAGSAACPEVHRLATALDEACRRGDEPAARAAVDSLGPALDELGAWLGARRVAQPTPG